MLSQSFIDEMKNELLKKLKELSEELQGISSHVELGDDTDAQAQEVEADEVSQDVIAAINSDMEKIKNALAKIDAGTYGIDDEGKEISEDRLRVLPWADKAL